MKLELTLPERPGLLHAVPVMNIFSLLVLFLAMGPSMLLQSGVTVELPPSRFQLDRYESMLVITLGRGDEGPRFHLGRDLVTRESLAARLGEVVATGDTSRVIVLIQTDANVSVAEEREMVEMVLGKGLRVALAGAGVRQPEHQSQETH
ncbi:MAG: biopolymer transporter ExbD [Verrucomicrobiota bacterium]